MHALMIIGSDSFSDITPWRTVRPQSAPHASRGRLCCVCVDAGCMFAADAAIHWQIERKAALCEFSPISGRSRKTLIAFPRWRICQRLESHSHYAADFALLISLIFISRAGGVFNGDDLPSLRPCD
jgi:hypothetical protein